MINMRYDPLGTLGWGSVHVQREKWGTKALKVGTKPKHVFRLGSYYYFGGRVLGQSIHKALKFLRPKKAARLLPRGP